MMTWRNLWQLTAFVLLMSSWTAGVYEYGVYWGGLVARAEMVLNMVAASQRDQ